MNNIKIASGSIIGSVHHKMCYNNQDHYIVEQNDDYIIGLVADGCGSGANSEVGAKLCLQFIRSFISHAIRSNAHWKETLEIEIHKYLEQLVTLHNPANSNHFIHENLLFTLVGFVVYNDEVTLFNAGDGVICINHDIKVIDQNNQPKYIAYGLQEKGQYMNFESYPIIEVSQLLVSSDGLEDLLEKNISINELFNDDFFVKEVNLNAWLYGLLNKNVLQDDTSIVMIKNFK
ncbi:MAG: protein phosphatase 2C domain-containing protein [Fermentimonas sp.]|nr:protein phosphatase 2C domain-containing protein [Dysgonamonadaceae bacterium]MDD4697754.1 protein phosphatase 2C domain-containing protein [Fermentimonas sp.]